MNLKRVLVVLLTMMLFALPAAAQEQTPANDIDFSPLTDVIQAQLEAQRAPGLAVGVVFDGIVIYSEGFGVRNTETNDPVTPDTLFRIGSTTKPLTTIGLLMLVEDGLVDLDAPVSSYVPEFTVSDDITVRHLLSHTSGMSDNAEPYGRLDPAALSDYVASFDESALFGQPGAAFSYSNPGFDTVGRIIETVSGMNYADYMAEEVFPALGMERTTLYPNLAMTYPFAAGYTPTMSGAFPVRPNVDNVAEYPAGFVFSSVNDLALLAEFVLSDGAINQESILTPESAQLMQTPVLGAGTIAYGLGLIISEYRGVTAVGHDGAINGYSSFFNTLPEYGLGVIVFANMDSFDATPIFDAAVDLLLDLPEVEPPPVPELSAADLAEYVGTYVMGDIYGETVLTIEVAMQDDHLIAHPTGQPEIEMRPVGVDTFALFYNGMDINTQVIFQRDSAGEVAFMSAGFRSAPRAE